MGCFSLYCQKCGLEFDNLDMNTLKELYGDKIPKELKKIEKSNILENGIFIRKNMKYYINSYDSYGSFNVVKTEKISDPSSNSRIIDNSIDVSNYIDKYMRTPKDSEKYTLTHEKCAELFVKHYEIASRLRGQQTDYSTYLRIVFPLSLSERNEEINKLLKVYHPDLKILVSKNSEYLKKEMKCPVGKILNTGTNRFVSKTGKVGKLIIEKSEKISDLIQM